MSTPDGRRFWAFIVILGGCFTFTAFAAVGVYLVSGNVKYSFYLALAAHLQLFIGMGAFSFVLGRRMSIEGSKGGFKYRDSSEPEAPETAIARQVAATADAGAAAIEQLQEGKPA